MNIKGRYNCMSLWIFLSENRILYRWILWMVYLVSQEEMRGLGLLDRLIKSAHFPVKATRNEEYLAKKYIK